ncbi:MAG: ferritin family protein [Solirubrobacterales bacterium]
MKKLICSICGLVINEKNYNFNKAAFKDENKVDNIIFCPFCGVKSMFISEFTGILEFDRNTMDEASLKIIDHAVKLEIFNGDFYKEASNLAKDEHNKEMFKALANIEYAHAKVHKYLGGFKEDPTISKLDYSKYDNDDILLEMACKREIHAVEFYNKYKRNMESPVVKSIFDALAEVEIEHIALTEK